MATIENPPNSIWPNGLKTDSEGYVTFYPLGTNKIDISTVTWPTGNKVISPFVYDENDKLVGFIDTNSLRSITVNDETTINYSEFRGEFKSPFIIKTDGNCNDIKLSFNVNEENTIKYENVSEDAKSYLNSAIKIKDNILYHTNNTIIGGYPIEAISTGKKLFYQNSSLKTFDSDLSSLVDGEQMFQACSSLTSFSGDLSHLETGYDMFSHTTLTTFNSDLPSLVDGDAMFYRSKIKSFDCDLSTLCYGFEMFSSTPLTTFDGDLSSLVDGRYMFDSSFLISFNSNLSSLTKADYMFYLCELDISSIKCIANTIKDVRGDGKQHRIDIGISSSSPNSTQNAAFWTMKNEKGWDVYVNGSEYNPTEATAIATLNENGEEVTTPIPFYAKPLEVEESDAEYVGEDGKFYNVVGGQFIYVSDPETYGQFTSLADAVANMRLTKIERN